MYAFTSVRAWLAVPPTSILYANTISISGQTEVRLIEMSQVDPNDWYPGILEWVALGKVKPMKSLLYSSEFCATQPVAVLLC